MCYKNYIMRPLRPHKLHSMPGQRDDVTPEFTGCLY